MNRFRYNKAISSRLLAQILLTACPSNSYTDFMEAWKIGSPDCIPPKEEYLHGIAIVIWNNQTIRKEVVLYPESNLPENINKRLHELFKVKEKWTVQEITPYIL
jgi:sister chromatid cohesion protein DCC1